MNTRWTVKIVAITALSILSTHFNTYSVINSIVREISEESMEILLRKGGREFTETLGKKFGKEILTEELIKRTVEEVGEVGAKRLFTELSEQAVKYGDDVFLVAKRLGVSYTVDLLKELPEDTGKKAIWALLNRGDELIPLVNKFGKEILEVEAKHPGLTIPVVKEFGQDGINIMKNYSTNQVMTLLRRKDILECLSPEGRRALYQQLKDRNVAEKIFDVFEKHPETTKALTSLCTILGSVYIISDKLLRTEITKQLPDGTIVKDGVSVLHQKLVKQNSDGQIEEETVGILGSLTKPFTDDSRFSFLFLVGLGVFFFFIIRGLAPIIIQRKRIDLN